MKTLTILSVAYPLAPVRSDTAGGAEQVLLAIDRALVSQGHRSLVVAMQGSDVAGTLIATPKVHGPFDAAVRVRAQAAHAAVIERACSEHRIDLVHMHGLDFEAYLPADSIPVLVTLHLPLEFYTPAALNPARPRTWLHCVSRAQQRAAPAGARFFPVIENGVDVDSFAAARRKLRFALFLGRICADKGVHLAIEAAARAAVPLAIAGEVFPYPEHQAYFAREIAPRLGRHCRFLGRVGPSARKRLLGAARCLLVPSLVAETSSLVAREALAAGTPIIGFARGALAEIVNPGHTGFLVNSVEDMAASIAEASRLDPEKCRADARRRFPLEAMIESYLRCYRRLARAPDGVCG